MGFFSPQAKERVIERNEGKVLAELDSRRQPAREIRRGVLRNKVNGFTSALCVHFAGLLAASRCNFPSVVRLRFFLFNLASRPCENSTTASHSSRADLSDFRLCRGFVYQRTTRITGPSNRCNRIAIASKRDYGCRRMTRVRYCLLIQKETRTRGGKESRTRRAGRRNGKYRPASCDRPTTVVLVTCACWKVGSRE